LNANTPPDDDGEEHLDAEAHRGEHDKVPKINRLVLDPPSSSKGLMQEKRRPEPAATERCAKHMREQSERVDWGKVN